jgi:hypothetical protein
MKGRKLTAQGRGELRADALYPLPVFLRRLGIGRHSLTALRRAGLPVRSIGTRLMIDGQEALDFLRRSWQQPAGDQGKAVSIMEQAGDGGQQP